MDNLDGFFECGNSTHIFLFLNSAKINKTIELLNGIFIKE